MTLRTGKKLLLYDFILFLWKTWTKIWLGTRVRECITCSLWPLPVCWPPLWKTLSFLQPSCCRERAFLTSSLRKRGVAPLVSHLLAQQEGNMGMAFSGQWWREESGLVWETDNHATFIFFVVGNIRQNSYHGCRILYLHLGNKVMTLMHVGNKQNIDHVPHCQVDKARYSLVVSNLVAH